MVNALYTHVTVLAEDLDESVRFYEGAFDMEQIPTPNWDIPIQWLQCGDLQLHLVTTDVEAPPFHHFAVHVDDLEAVYAAVRDHDTAHVERLNPDVEDSSTDGEPPVYYLPHGTVQLYVRDPSGNLVEVNYPDIDELDRSIVPNTVKREDLEPSEPGENRGDIYGEFGVQPDEDA